MPSEPNRAASAQIGRKTLSRALPRWREVQANLAKRFGEDSFRSAVELMMGIARAGEALLDHPLS